MTDNQTHTDAFVSYRRKNVEFVKAFVDKLRENDKEVWIDWEDIPPGSESFTDDIRRGIEGADAFIAILSPDYLESTYTVDLELGYAVELKKKIIPVVYRKFDDYDIPADISHINWIYFTPHAGQPNTIDDGIPRVIEALEVDFDYVREHTRLLQRAREWDENERTNGYLMMGEEIINAEYWLATSVGKQPSASSIHHEFIQASRQRAIQITRRNFTIAIVVTIFSVLLAGFALVQRQIAVEQTIIAQQQRAIAETERDRAEEQQRLSDSRRLSVQSRVELGLGEVDTALLLGLEAIQSADTIEAIGSLVAAFENNPYLDTILYDHPSALTSVAYHPSEPIVVTGGEDGSLRLWDMDTQVVTTAISTTNNEVWDIAYQPDGTRFVVGTASGSLDIYSTEGNLIKSIVDIHTWIITSVAYSPDGTQLLTTSYDGNAILWQTASLLDDEPEYMVLTIDDAATTHTDWILDATWHPDGTQVAIMTWDNILQIWDSVSGTQSVDPLQLNIGSGNFSVSIAWSPNGQFILMGDVLGTIRFADATTGQLVDFQLSRHTDHVREIVYHPSGEYFASVSHDGDIYLWDAGNGQLITEKPIAVHGNHVNGVAFSSDGNRMVTVGDDGRVVLFNMTQPDLLADFVLAHESEIYQVIYADTGIISVGLDGNVYQTDPESSESIVLFSPDIGRLTAADLSADGTILALATDTGIVQLWNIDTGEAINDALTAHAASIFGVKFNPTGEQLATAGDDNLVKIWQVSDLMNNINTPIELSGHDDGIFDLAWHPDDNLLASASRDTTIILWDVAEEERLATLYGHEDDIETVMFSPDGDWLASGGRDNAILLWDLTADSIEPEELGTHDDWVLSLDFTEDGQTLVSGGRDRNLILWDMASLQSIGGALTHHDSWIWTVAISPDQQTVATGGRDGHLVIWDINRDNWQALACHIANRNLTNDEWRQFRPNEPYRVTC